MRLCGGLSRTLRLCGCTVACQRSCLIPPTEVVRGGDVCQWPRQITGQDRVSACWTPTPHCVVHCSGPCAAARAGTAVPGAWAGMTAVSWPHNSLWIFRRCLPCACGHVQTTSRAHTAPALHRRRVGACVCVAVAVGSACRVDGCIRGVAPTPCDGRSQRVGFWVSSAPAHHLTHRLLLPRSTAVLWSCAVS